MGTWTETDLAMAQTAMFDVVLTEIVPSLHAADQSTTEEDKSEDE